MSSMINKADVVIIGGGIVGAAIARELSRYHLDIVLLEAEPDVAMGTSKANSAILHAGFDAQPGCWKAKLNVRGNELYRQLEDELKLHIKWTGSLVVAKSQADMAILAQLLERGRQNGVPGLEILPPDRLFEHEPNLDKGIAGALWAPTAGIICPFGATVAFMENAIRNGAILLRETAALGIMLEHGRVSGVRTTQGMIHTAFVVNAAGVRADDIARLAGDDSFAINARKGEYILFDRSVSGLVNRVIFPTPDAISKGILIAPTVHGNVFIGPDAQDVDDKADTAATSLGMEHVISGARRLVPDLPLTAAITQFSGLRAAAEGGDFILRESKTARGLIHAAGIQSPGLTAAPAIAQVISGLLREAGLKQTAKRDFNPVNPARPSFQDLNWQQRAALIAGDPRYGRIICRCETVTEAEIVAAIHSPCGARTVDGVKRRVRAGSGRCQGGFCGPRVTAILARELHIPVTQVRKDSVNSYLFIDKMPGYCEVAAHE